MGMLEKFLTVRYLILVVCILSYLLEGINSSINGPFYPDMARSKGASYSEIGLTVGIFFVSSAMSSLFLGAINNPFQTKTIFTTGLLLSAGSVICFGLMGQSVPGTVFVVMCMVCRFVMGYGASAVFACAMPILLQQFPESPGKMTSLLQTTIGIGLTLGPPFGSVLYVAGNYSTPFITAGAMEILLALCAAIWLPNFSSHQLSSAQEEEEERERLVRERSMSERDALFERQASQISFEESFSPGRPGMGGGGGDISYRQFLSNASLWMVSLPALSLTCMGGYRDTVYATYLKYQIGVEDNAVFGFIFIFSSVAYFCASILYGALLDRGYAGLILSFGLCTAPFVPLLMYLGSIVPALNNLPVSFAILFLNGASSASYFAPTYLILDKISAQYLCSPHLVEEDRLHQQKQVRLMVAAWYTVARSVGRVLGCFLFGGALIDALGLATGNLVFAIYLAAMGAICILFIFNLGLLKKVPKEANEKQLMSITESG